MLSLDGTTITMTRGDTARIQLSLTYKEGSDYVALNGDTIRFAVKKRYTDSNVLININIPTDTLLLEIKPEDTKALAFGNYKYDIQLSRLDGTVDTFVDRATLVLTEEVD